MPNHVTPPANHNFDVTQLPSSDNWQVVEVFNSDFEASVAKGAIEAEGIPAQLTNQTFGSILPIGFNSIGGVSLWVPTDMADKALEILRKNNDIDSSTFSKQ